MTAKILIGIVAALHIFFMILEMFLWTKPFGLKFLRQNSEKAKATKVMAMNQGLYNGFLAAGLIFGMLHSDSVFSLQLKVFFLSCVILAGIFGAVTASRGILWIQAVPGAIALFFTLC